MRLLARGRSFELAEGVPLVMGIVNVGSDSVADSLHLETLDKQLRVARQQIANGADVIDVGAQSGRTDTPVISEQREIELLTPLIGVLAAEGVLVSVDTWRANVAEAALAAGAAIVNDVGGLVEPELVDVVARHRAALVLMHTKAPPKVEHFPGYHDPVSDVRARLAELIEQASDRGVGTDQLILDPGLDYAKRPAESIAVLRRLAELRGFERPLLLAVSRKYFLGVMRARLPEERLAATLSAIGFGVDAGASIVRVHDVAATVDYLAVRAALRSDAPAPLLGDAESEQLKWLPPKRAAQRQSD